MYMKREGEGRKNMKMCPAADAVSKNGFAEWTCCIGGTPDTAP